MITAQANLDFTLSPCSCGRDSIFVQRSGLASSHNFAALLSRLRSAYLRPKPQPIGRPLLRDIEDEPDEGTRHSPDDGGSEEGSITARSDRAD